MQRCFRSPGLAGAPKERCVLLPPPVFKCPCNPRLARQRLTHKPLLTASASSGSSAAADDSAPQGFNLPKFKLLPDSSAWQLVSDSWSLVYSNIWAIVLIFALKDAAAFLLHRSAHRLTNHLAEVLFGLPVSSMGNPWWIMVDPKFVEGNFSYQVLVGIFFIICLPLNILFNTAAVSTAAVVCTAPRPSAKPHAVPSATYTGQGRGKVGLAECRSTSSLDDGQCEAEWEQFDSSSSDSSSASSSSSSSGGREGSATAAAAGQVSFKSSGAGSVSFRQQAAAAAADVSSTSVSAGSPLQQPATSSAAVTAAADNKQQQQHKQSGKQQQQQHPPQPAAAPTLPWLNPMQHKPRLPKPPGLTPSIAMVREAWSKQVAERLRQLWKVDILFNIRALPLQALCLAVLPVFWAFPKLLEIQLALPAAVLAGAKGTAALQRSQELMKGFKASYAWPFVWLIVLGRAFDLVREFVLVSIPSRWWTDVIEVPLAATAFFVVVRLLLLRVQDLVPLAAYLYLQRKKRAAAAASAL